MASNQEQHIVYQQQYPASYHQNVPISTWNQPPQQQPLAYAVSYHAPDVSGYQEKSQFGYTQVQYENDMIRTQQQQQGFATQFTPAQAGQWPQYQSQQGQQFAFAGYTPANLPADAYNTAPPPNMNRPPPGVKHEPDTFNGISMLENPAQTAAAYTASWVSSTSSIPPEMRDEPDPNIHDEPFTHFGEQFENKAYPQYRNNRNSSNFAGDSAVGHWDMRANNWHGDDRGKKNDFGGRKGGERKIREEPRELTWDERLKKAQVQKERVEMRDNNGRDNNFRGGRGGGGPPNGSRGGRDSQFGRGGNQTSEKRNFNNREWKPETANPEVPKGPSTNAYGQRFEEDNRQKIVPGEPSRFVPAPQMAIPNGQAVPWFNPPMQPIQPQMAGIPQMIPGASNNFRGGRGAATLVRPARGALQPPMPTIIPFAQPAQDQKFRNTWLDAQSYGPFIPVVPVPAFERMNRGWIRQGGRRYVVKENHEETSSSPVQTNEVKPEVEKPVAGPEKATEAEAQSSANKN
ncbi:unnamed protein product [Caenorhabditis auriculariae]|uniref:Uncharacterized protein n=1 Tax=Caenorhabditis auriculariae TaxID=2777116 RepID=A0A8S1GUA7_9PELO|nr:unnamed protein product [Caenorhabditis auriculariae]